MGDRVENV